MQNPQLHNLNSAPQTRYDNPEGILRDFFYVRLDHYSARKKYMVRNPHPP